MARTLAASLCAIAILAMFHPGAALADSILLCEEPEPSRTLEGEITRFVGGGDNPSMASSIVFETGSGGPWVVNVVGHIDLLEVGERYQMTIYSVTTTARREDRAFLHFEGCGPTTSIWRIDDDGIVESIPAPPAAAENRPIQDRLILPGLIALVSAAAGAMLALGLAFRLRQSGAS